jgi:chromate reductase
MQAAHTNGTTILGIAGSLRKGSYNWRLLRAAAGLAPGARLVIWEGLKSVPPFDEDDEHAPPPAVLELREAIAGADAVLVATPEYNHSIPGQLKNAIDWASRPRGKAVLAGKPVAVMGASPSPRGAVAAQADTRRALVAAGARVLDRELAVARAHERIDADGRLVDEEIAGRLASQLAELAARAAPATDGSLDLLAA